MKKLLAVLAVAVSSLGVATSAWASTIYSYTGNNFNQITNDIWLPVPGEYTTAMYVSGWFEVADPIAANESNMFITPLSYSFSDGRNTYTNLDSVLSTSADPDKFIVSTDGAGQIFNWSIGVESFGTGNLWTRNFALAVYDYGAVEPNWFSSTTQRDNAIVYDNPGVWTSTSSVPEPSTLLLLGSGMVGLAMTRIRKFRKNG